MAGESQEYTKNISLQKVHYNLSNKGKFLLVIIYFFILNCADTHF